MGYPRKSYPHRCSPPCAKRSRPRACARVYIIYRSSVGRSRECPRRCGEEVAPLWPRVPRRRAQGGGGRGQRRTPPRAVPRTCPPTAVPLPLVCRITVRKGGVHKAIPAPARAYSPRRLVYGRAPARLWPNHCAQRRSAQGNPRSCPCVLPASARLRPRPRPLVCRITVRKGGSAQGDPRPRPCVLPAAACLRPCTLPADGRSAVRSSRVSPPTATPSPACVPDHCAQWRKCTRQSPLLPVRTPRAGLPTAAPPPADGRSAVRRVGEGEGKGGRPLAQQPAPVCLPPRPRRLNGHPASAGGRENDRMAHRHPAPPTHRTQRGNDTCTIRVPRRKGAQSVVHNLYFSSSRPASFCTTFPQSCTDRPATCRKEHKSPPEGLIFRVLPPAFPPYPPKAIVQNTPAPPPFFPRKTPCFAPTRNRVRTLASAERDNTPRPAHSSRFQRDTNESAAYEMPIFAPPKAENGGVCGLKC